MNLEVQTTLLNTYPQVREQLKENDPLNAVDEIVGPVTEIHLECEEILREGERFWDDVNGGYLPEDLVLAARREEIDWVHSEGVYEIVSMQECRDAGMKPLDLNWLDTDKSVDPTRKKIRSKLCAREYKTKKQGKIQRVLPASQLFSAVPPLKAVQMLVSTMMSVSLSSKGKPLKLRHYDISRAHFQGKPRDSFTSNYPQRIVRSMAKTKVGRLIKSIYGTQEASHIWLPDHVNLICGRVRELPKRQTQRSICSTIQIKL